MNAPSEQFQDSDSLEVSKTLLIGLGGPTGGGKTETAMRVARGIVGPNGRFGVIDTENKRALNKKTRYRFDHLDMKPPYSPEHFRELIEQSMKAGHKATVVDSWSAEWDDEGGLSEEADNALERLSKGNSEIASRLTGLAWKQPKIRHKAFMRWVRKLEHPIIFCLRAEPKIKYVKDEKGKTQVVDAGWLPITEKLFGYDMLVYALMMAENPGVPVHLKKLEQEFEPMFPIGKQVTENAGALLAQWAAGAKVEYITVEQTNALEAGCEENGIAVERLTRAAKVERISQIKASDFDRAKAWLDAAIAAKKQPTGATA